MNWQLLARANTHRCGSRSSKCSPWTEGGPSPPVTSATSCERRSANYHVTELLRTGLVELAGERPVRGATEHFYREATGAKPRRNGSARNGRRRRKGVFKESAEPVGASDVGDR